MSSVARAQNGVRRGRIRRLQATMLAAVVMAAGLIGLQAPDAASAAGGSSCGATVNPVVCENSKPGTDPSVWDIEGAGDPSIQGFATDISVNAGSSIDFKVDTTASAYSVDIYRTGWYDGRGARKVASVSPSAALPQVQPQCLSDIATELYDCGTWGVSASWSVPADAVSGVYVAKLTRTDTGGASHIIFIVRRDGNTSDVLFQTSDPTWQAYNTYGGSNFYQGAGNGRAYKISYNRPLATRGDLSGRDSYFSSEYATVRFLERNGYDVSYLAGIDTDRRGGELKNHKVFLSVGHDEYWSGAQRANITAARDAGVNLQFLSGNDGYWRTRYEASSASGTATDHRTLVSYKETWSNGKLDPSTEWTGTWRDPRFAGADTGGTLPENALIGTMFMANKDDLAITVSSEEGRLRLWRGTSLASLASGTSAALADHTIGYESNEDIDNGYRPAGLIRMSTTTGSTPEYLTDYGNSVSPGTTTHHLTQYRAASGSLVFSAGSIQWGWGLDATHDGAGAPADPRMQQAQVNLFADMGVQPATLMTGLAAASKSTDTTAPTTTITSPAAGVEIASGAATTISGTASDAAGRVAGVEVSVDGGATWHPATGTTSWTYTFIQQGSGSVSLIARAVDDSGNFSKTGTTRTVTVTGPFQALGNVVPAIASADDGGGVELGLRFTPDSNGYITGVRFYKGPANTGTHVGSLWDSLGNRLAIVTFTDETATGWQTAQFARPVAVTAGTLYVVSYTAPEGGYAFQTQYWPYHATSSSPLTVAPTTGADAAGVYGVPRQFPRDTFREANYFVDAMFVDAGSTPVHVTTRTPSADATGVARDITIAATLDRAVVAASVQLSVSSSSGAVAGATTYDPATHTARFLPDQDLAGSTAYTVTVAATDSRGNHVEDGSAWSFTTAAVGAADGDCPCTLFPDSTVPTIASANDPAQVTLGVTLTPTVTGKITALRFFKGSANAGEHTATLWAADGTVLSTATFQNETSSGWQTVALATPVTVTQGQSYVVSYVALNGGYSATTGRFDSAYTRGPLSVPVRGGLYSYTGGFPTHTSTADYGVDAVFSPTPQAPVVQSTSPASGQTAVATTATVSATFGSTIASTYRGSVTVGGTAVAGAWAMSEDRRTVSFTPTGPFTAGAQVSVAITGISGTNGRSGADVSWSFTVGNGAAQQITTLLGSTTPQVASETGDSAAVELGMAFHATKNGQVTAIRFFKGAGNTGTHVGSLWDANGALLAQVTFTGESASGWQRAALLTPVDLRAGAVYTVSYQAPAGHYSYTPAAFTNGATNGPLVAESGANGRYRYGATGQAPTASYRSTNYFVDVEFATADPGPAVVAVAPGRSAGSVATSAAVTATFDRNVAGSSPALRVTGPQGTAVTGAVSYSAADHTVSFQPAAAFATATTYTATATLNGATVDTWTFTTASAPLTGAVETLFGQTVPETASVGDTDSVELGTAFAVSEPGQVTAIRFYKGAANTGTHVGSLWAADGTLLAQVTFTGESESGWQRAVLATPVDIVAGTTYVVSYFAPAGGYSHTGSYFLSERQNGRVTGLAQDNGRYRYGSGGVMPSSSFRSSAYFVDAEVTFG